MEKEVRKKKAHRAPQFPCPDPSCTRWFRNHSGLRKHVRCYHPVEDNMEDNVSESGMVPADNDRLSPSGNDWEMEDNNLFSEESNVEEDGRDVGVDMEDNVRSAGDEGGGDEGRNEGEDDDLNIDVQADSDSHCSTGNRSKRIYHPVMTGVPCTVTGELLPPGSPPPSCSIPEKSWAPYQDQLNFEFVDFMYRRNEMPQSQTDHLLDLLTAYARQLNPDAEPPCANHKELLETIDATPTSTPSWDKFSLNYTGPLPRSGEPATWMVQDYTIWYRNPKQCVEAMLKNPDFLNEIEYGPYKEYDKGGNRRYKDFMSGDWAWDQADKIALDKEVDSDGCVFMPVILGSDKTTVSVATGQNEYYPLYLSIGGVLNSVRRAHRGAVTVLAFLANPKADRKYNDDPKYRIFRRQLFHYSLSTILQSLKENMRKYAVMMFPDGHYRRVIFGIGPYIADYPEQVLLACVLQGWCARCLGLPENLDLLRPWRNRVHTDRVINVFDQKYLSETYGLVKSLVSFTNDFPRADIHELLAPDILHQIIKGAFKDHLVAWVEILLTKLHGKSRGQRIMDDIDHRIALVPAFAALRRFPQGRGFKQWTGDDSKALMKVYLPALVGHVPEEVIHTFRAFLDFCYLVRRSVLTDRNIEEIEEALDIFHENRTIFQTLGARPEGFSLPHQHSMVHYADLIRFYGAPNGLCSSITESKHIVAVKKPWRRSNRYNALGQMLLTNERLDKLHEARMRFKSLGMLTNDFLGNNNLENENDASFNDELEDDEVVDGPTTTGSVRLALTPQRGYPRDIQRLGPHTGFNNLALLARKFLYYQLHLDDPFDVPASFCPDFNCNADVFHAATAVFYSPSDPSGVGGMKHEQIRSTPKWRKDGARYDTVFVKTNSTMPGMQGMHVARVFLFFSLHTEHKSYPCALVHWFGFTDNAPDRLTGMWIVSPEYRGEELFLTIIHIDTILRAAHLIPVFGEGFVADSHELDHTQTLNNFNLFYVNKYIDHHAFETVF